MVLKRDVVEDTAYFSLRKSQVNAMETDRLGIFHVSDLIKDCMRYSAYNKIIPREWKLMTTEDMKSLFMGQAIHSNTMMAKPEYHEMFLAYDLVKKVGLTLEEAKKIKRNDERQLDIIYGSIDDVLKINGEFVICDKKTTGSMDYFRRKRDKKPSESHMKQINAYRSLLKKCYNIDADYGCVIYMPNSISKEENDKPHPMYFKLDPIEKTDEWLFKNHEVLKDFMITEELPSRTRNFMCDGYCPYAIRCFKEFENE